MSLLSALPPAADPWSVLVERGDVVVDRGILHLVHDDVAPHHAREADLLLVAAALDDAGIETLLIRHDSGVPALAVDLAHREAALAALAELCTREPLYLKAKGRPPVLASDAAPIPDAPATVRLFRPRITRGGSLRYGAALGVHLEFWRFGSETVEAPRDNALMRRRTAAEDVACTTVERYDRVWRTPAGMFDPHPLEVTYDIDMVFSWVDGSSSDFRRQRAAQLAEYVVGEGDDGPARYRHVDELRYALRSVHMYAPWVRRIFIATDSPAPAWLLDHPKVTIVRSEEFFADPSVLPTHNSHAVEAQLHRIPGLAEHFLYSNDDMFFGRAVAPEMFFTPAGVTKFVECEVRIGAGDPALHRSGHDNGLRVNRALLKERFGRTIVRDLEHCAAPLRKSVMAELEDAFPDDFARTAASRFRSATDISVTNSLYHYYALLTGRAVPTRAPRVRYAQTTLPRGLRLMERLAERCDADMFCLNDGGEREVAEEIRVRAIRSALERMFPVRAPWERDELSAARESARSAHPSARR
ncbi:stealth conserved region 3 domain-containing protein [Microbacterium sp. M3]|uniref:Stealth conserved region 3 domain-containing protein n=1 Tax=Microbacterium arthrosphaerae TaxID=792652 RepID=A0ABU4GW98_9MICO|nr:MULTISPECIES: stealth conserved region 3 domain-containing protein [Microbacterium]MDW4571290.1 stealth conserved region 3 domain-containing protein [Microbacterium arthrosphaerae]MDW7605145.1 stealth conserved region 3 domain-containing protein [Microbacterium sp. M3]